jgi:hypothetical protein
MRAELKRKIADFILWAVPIIFLVFGVYRFTKEGGWVGVIAIGLGCGELGYMVRKYFSG